MAKRPTKAECRAEPLASLRKCAESEDYKDAHFDADEALIAFIDDAEVTELYNQVGKWYA